MKDKQTGGISVWMGLLLLLTLVLPQPLGAAEAPAIEWTRMYGGSYPGISVRQTTDGGYVFITHVGSVNYENISLIKTDSSGNRQWTKYFGDIEGDEGRCVQQTPDGGYIVCGQTSPHSNPSDPTTVYLVKTDVNGNLEWERRLGSRVGGQSIHQTPDGGYVVFGEDSNLTIGRTDLFTMKTDANGNMVWNKILGSTVSDSAGRMQPTRDGGYILTGSRANHQAPGLFSYPYLIKIDANGDAQWENTFGEGAGLDVKQTSDGGYIITGSTPREYPHDVYLIKTGPNGDMQWSKTFGGPNIDQGLSVLQTYDGGYLCSGRSDKRPYFIRTDANGNTEWEIIGAGLPSGSVCCVGKTFDGGYVASGKSNGQAFLIKLAPDGPALLCARSSWLLYR